MPPPAGRASTYAQVAVLDHSPAADMPPAGEWATQGRRRRVGGPNTNTGRRPVDPRLEGRCLRCMARDHTIMTCREPIKCRLCLQGGYRQASCPLQVTTSSLPATRGLYACLVGEIRTADLEWSHIIDGLRELRPDLKDPNCHRLISGYVFLRRLMKEAWRLLHGRSQHGVVLSLRTGP